MPRIKLKENIVLILLVLIGFISFSLLISVVSLFTNYVSDLTRLSIIQSQIAIVLTGIAILYTMRVPIKKALKRVLP